MTGIKISGKIKSGIIRNNIYVGDKDFLDMTDVSEIEYIEIDGNTLIASDVINFVRENRASGDNDKSIAKKLIEKLGISANIATVASYIQTIV